MGVFTEPPPQAPERALGLLIEIIILYEGSDSRLAPRLSVLQKKSERGPERQPREALGDGVDGKREIKSTCRKRRKNTHLPSKGWPVPCSGGLVGGSMPCPGQQLLGAEE